MSDRYPEQASNYSVQPRYPWPQDPPMGTLAAADSYAPSDWPAGPAELPDIGAPLVPSGPQVSAGAPWANKLADTLTTPQPASTDNTVLYKTANPNVNFTQADIDRGFGLGMSFSGGGLGIKAYHGSPHDFDKFDLSKIGTGEGAQAYGHGLYFAENEGVAKSYKMAGRAGYQNQSAADAAQAAYDSAVQAGASDPYAKARTLLQDSFQFEHDPNSKRVYQDALNNITEIAGPHGAKSGKMYEVNINADPAHFLDWDKPLREQAAGAKLPPEMIDQAKREAYNRALASTSKQRADELWGMVKDPMQAPGGFMVEAGKYMRSPQISADLNARGIPGIKYLDQGSRTPDVFKVQTDILPGANKYHVIDPNTKVRHATFDTREEAAAFAKAKEEANQTRNYVLFNDKLIDILRKYGLAGAAPAGMGALAAQDNYPPQ